MELEFRTQYHEPELDKENVDESGKCKKKNFFFFFGEPKKKKKKKKTYLDDRR